MSKTAASWLVVLALTLSGCAGVYIPSTYASYSGANNLPRERPHAGVDFAAAYSSPALAAADGKVLLVTDRFYSSVLQRLKGCGYSVLIAHDQFARYTVYCHLKEVLVEPGDTVKRGDVIGLVGTTGNSGNVPHVHLELCVSMCPSGHADGDLKNTEDPLARADGCFDPNKQYPTDRLVLTYPVKC